MLCSALAVLVRMVMMTTARGGTEEYDALLVLFVSMPATIAITTMPNYHIAIISGTHILYSYDQCSDWYYDL